MNVSDDIVIDVADIADVPGKGEVVTCTGCKGSGTCGCRFCLTPRCPHCQGLGLRRVKGAS